MNQFPVTQIATGVHVFGPHALRFWPGNFALLRKRFQQVAETIEDKSSPEYADALRLIGQISMDRDEFDALPDEDKPAWLVNMPVVELSGSAPGLLVYSPLPLDSEGELRHALEKIGPVRVVVAPMGGHTAGLSSFREAFADALFLCSRGGGFLGMDLIDQRPEVGFHLALRDSASIAKDQVLSDLLGGDFDL